MEQYSWAKNKHKLLRAISNSDNQTEEQVKELYISYGGLVDEKVEKINIVADGEVVAKMTPTQIEKAIIKEEVATGTEEIENTAEVTTSEEVIKEEVIVEKKSKKKNVK